jgi:hypothetical protein
LVFWISHNEQHDLKFVIAVLQVGQEETAVKEENMPDGVTVVEERDLVVHRQPVKQLESRTTSNSSVKNFKVFRKVIIAHLFMYF